MWDFEHPPLNASLADRYQLHLHPTLPVRRRAARTAAPTSASSSPSRSLTRRPGHRPRLRHRRARLRALHSIDSQAAAQPPKPSAPSPSILASRSSIAYAQILVQEIPRRPIPPSRARARADPIAMLREHEASSPHRRPRAPSPSKLAARSSKPFSRNVPGTTSPTNGLLALRSPWVAAVWAVRPDALTASHVTAQQLSEDLNHSPRSSGLCEHRHAGRRVDTAYRLFPPQPFATTSPVTSITPSILPASEAIEIFPPLCRRD